MVAGPTLPDPLPKRTYLQTAARKFPIRAPLDPRRTDAVVARPAEPSCQGATDRETMSPKRARAARLGGRVPEELPAGRRQRCSRRQR